MDFSWIRLLVVALFALLLVTRSEQLSDKAPCVAAPATMHRLVNAGATAFVFVPAENFSASVEIVVPTEAEAGEWIPLRAKRWSGPWKGVWAVRMTSAKGTSVINSQRPLKAMAKPMMPSPTW
jgi:hypothetical protein